MYVKQQAGKILVVSVTNCFKLYIPCIRASRCRANMSVYEVQKITRDGSSKKERRLEEISAFEVPEWTCSRSLAYSP
jgi:hypothetical protein